MLKNILNKTRLQIFCGIILLVAFALSACNEAPTEVGMDFLNDTVSIKFLDDAITNTVANSIKTSAMNTGGVLIGSAGSLRSAALMRFDLFSVSRNARERIIDGIVECKLYIYPQNYAFGDTVSNLLEFEIREIMNFWFHAETTSDDVFYSEHLFAGGRTLGDTSVNIVRKDTMDAIVIDFPKEVFVEWMVKSPDPANITDTIWGIALYPKQTSTIINRFAAFGSGSSVGTVLKVKYYKDDDKTELDSIEVRAVPECSYVDLQEEYNSEDLMIQGGVWIQSKIDFNISDIPIFGCVHYAELTLTLDENKSDRNIDSTDMIAIIRVRDTTVGGREVTVRDNIVSGIYDSATQTITFKDFLNIPLNKIIRREDGEGTLVLAFQSIAQEANSLTKFVFHNMNSSEISKRPKIKIVYSQP